MSFKLKGSKFLRDGELLTLTNQLFSEVKKELIILSPWIEMIGHLEERLRLSISSKKPNVTVLTRKPDNQNHSEAVLKLQNMGAQIFFDEKLHAKLILVDRNYALITSTNLLPRSLSENHEIGIFTDDYRIIDEILDYLFDLEDILRAPILHRSDDRYETAASRIIDKLANKFSRKDIPTAEEYFTTCPKCNKPLVEKLNTQYGDFWGCKGFPDCNYVRNIKWKA
ncbi:MAG: topoisomerase DNA-binding C4 zinc finger domain-containing protein [Candidatus Hodarchaeota archaeon]